MATPIHNYIWVGYVSHVSMFLITLLTYMMMSVCFSPLRSVIVSREYECDKHFLYNFSDWPTLSIVPKSFS